MTKTRTADLLLEAARREVQTRGFNAFSYADLAEAVGIRTASIHYHFRTKADLGRALMDRYLLEIEARLAEIDRDSTSARERLDRFVDLHRCTSGEGLLCLCGSMLSDYATLPGEVQRGIDGYLDLCETWIRTTVEAGAAAGELAPRVSAGDLATSLLAGLQGALLVARARGGRVIVDRIQRSFVESLGS